jgi:ribosomal protein L11 methyltransferase
MRFRADTDMADTAAWLIAEALDHPVEVRDAITMSAIGEGSEVVIAFDGQPREDIAVQMRAALRPIGLHDVAVETISSEDESWREGWRAFFKGQRLGDESWVGPPWEPKPATPIAVHIEPGAAFGTGTHETTQGCLIMLARILMNHQPMRMLDVGCGSAVLSIAAAQLGHSVLAVDIDGDALANAQHNVELNEVGERIEIRHATAGDLDESFPVVVANILAPILIPKPLR